MFLSLPPDERLRLEANRSCASPALSKCSKVASLCSTLEQVGGIRVLRLKLLSHFYCPFSTGLPPPPEQLRAVSVTHFRWPPRFGSFIREPLVAPRRSASHFVPPWNFQRGSKALPALLAGPVTTGYRMGYPVHFMVESIATNFHYGATLATLGI